MKNLLNKFMLSTKYFAAIIALLGLLMVGGNSWGQQVIGTFPYMDGGFEGQTATASIGSTLSATAWSVSSGTNSTTRAIISGALARSGNQYVEHARNATSTMRLQTPAVAGSLSMNTYYVVQYYYNTITNPTSSGLEGAIYTNSKSSNYIRASINN